MLGAESEAEAKTRWWRSNRVDSPDPFDDELAEALGGDPPRSDDRRDTPVTPPGYRPKRLMPRTKNHVYFAVYEGVILIVSIWGAPRRRGPKL